MSLILKILLLSANFCFNTCETLIGSSTTSFENRRYNKHIKPLYLRRWLKTLQLCGVYQPL